MSIEETLIRLLQSKGWKQADLSRIAGIPSSLISNYIKGTKSPTLTNSIKLAEAFEISIDELAGIAIKKTPPSEDEDADVIELIDNYNKVNAAGQDALLKYSRLLLKDDQFLSCAQFELGKEA